MNTVSQEFLDAAASGDATEVTIAEVWSGPTATSPPAKITTLGTVLSATWSEDETRSPRRQMQMVVESGGIGVDDLVPNLTTSLLHPLTGNEIRIFSGYQFADGSQEVTPCGVYRMTKPAMVDPGDAVTITITGQDRAFEVTRRDYTDPYPITGAPTIDSAIHDLIDSRMPGLNYNLEPSTYSVPDITLGASTSSAGDPMADAISLATGGGMEVFFDSQGTVVLRTVPDPTTAPISLVFAEGGFVLLEADRAIDETSTFNGVICIGNGAGLAAPIQEAVWVTDPTSPLNPAVFGYVPYRLVSSTVTTSAQAIAAASAKLQTLLTAFDDTGFTAVGNPALACGDGLSLKRPRLGTNGVYVASSIAWTADVATAMTVINRAKRSPS